MPHLTNRLKMLQLLAASLSLSTTLALPSTSCRKNADCLSADHQCFFAEGKRNQASSSANGGGLCFNVQRLNDAPEDANNVKTVTALVDFLEVDEKTSGATAATPTNGGTFTLSAPAGSAASVVLGVKSYTLGVSKDGDFNVQRDGAPEPYLSFKADGSVQSNLLKMSATNIDAASGFSAVDAAGGIVRQWSTVASDTFTMNKEEDKYKGWEVASAESEGGMSLSVQKCGGVTLLGGPSEGDANSGFHRGEISKTFGNLRNHSAVRISASFHFIDLWLGEFAYMKVSSGGKSASSTSGGSAAAVVDEYVWTKSYHAASGMGTANHKHPPSGVNICGDKNVIENDFVSNIDVSVPHNMDYLTVTFGTKLPPTAGAAVGGASWGLSRIDVEIKNVDESQL